MIKSPTSRISRDTGWCLLGSAIPCSNARRNAKRSSPGRLPLTLHSIEAAGLVYFFGSTGVSQSHVWSRCKAGTSRVCKSRNSIKTQPRATCGLPNETGATRGHHGRGCLLDRPEDSGQLELRQGEGKPRGLLSADCRKRAARFRGLSARGNVCSDEGELTMAQRR